MSEVEADTYIEPRYRATPEAERLLEPEPIDRPIPASDRDSIYENPYSTHIYHDFGGSIIIRNFNDGQSTDETFLQKIEQRKWHLLCLILGLLTGVIVTGLSMYIAKTPACRSLTTIIEKLKMKQFKQVSDLENCKSAQSDLDASRQDQRIYKILEDQNFKLKFLTI